MKTYYAVLNLENRRLGAYVSAENVAGALKTATARYKTRHPRLHLETIAVQEMADEYLDGVLASACCPPSSAAHYLGINRSYA